MVVGPIIWQGSPNFWVGRDGESIEAICDHIMAGYMEGTKSSFQSPARQASTHYAVAKDGRIWQYVREIDTAWGNGIWEDPDLDVPFLADAFRRKVNPNHLTVSIEHEGQTGEEFTEEMYQSTLWLHRFIISHNPKIQANRNHMIGHYQISFLSRPFCPGKGFPWTRLLGDLNMTAPVEHPGYAWQDQVTSFWVVEPFASFYVNHGGLEIFGRPIGPMTKSDPLYPGVLIQNFERARFEQTDSMAPLKKVQLGLINSQLLELRKA